MKMMTKDDEEEETFFMGGWLDKQRRRGRTFGKVKIEDELMRIENKRGKRSGRG